MVAGKGIFTMACCLKLSCEVRQAYQNWVDWVDLKQRRFIVKKPLELQELDSDSDYDNKVVMEFIHID